MSEPTAKAFKTAFGRPLTNQVPSEPQCLTAPEAKEKDFRCGHSHYQSRGVARGGGADKATTAAEGAGIRGVSTPTKITEKEKKTFRERTRTTSSKETLF